MATEQVLTQEVKQLKSSIKNSVKRSRISLAGNDDTKYQLSQIKYFADKVKNTHIVFPYGLAANPPEGEEALMFNIMGQEENTAAIPYATTVRFKNLQKKEVRIGNPFSSASVLFRNDGVSAINGSEFEGIIKINDLTTKLNALVTDYNSHIHTGVQTGAGSTATPTPTTNSFSKSDYENTNVVHGEQGTGTSGGSSGTPSGAVEWGNITGTLSNQTDLQAALDAKLSAETDPIFTASPAFTISGSDITNWNTAYGWGDHSVAGYLKNIVEDTTPQLGGDLDPNGKKLLADLNFNYFEAVRMVADNDVVANLPNTGNEVDGQWFYANDIKTLFLYEQAWKPIVSFGAVTMYVDGTNGTDASGKGYASGTGAFKTIQYAIDNIPSINGGDIIVNIASGTYTEDLTIQGKIYSVPANITFKGLLSSQHTGSVSSATQGSRSFTVGFGTITESPSPAWTIDQYKGMLVYNSGLDEYKIIYSNTADTVTVTGRWENGTPSGTFTIYDWATIISPSTTSVMVQEGQKSVNWQDIKFSNTLTTSRTMEYISNATGLVERCSFIDTASNQFTMAIQTASRLELYDVFIDTPARAFNNVDFSRVVTQAAYITTSGTPTAFLYRGVQSFGRILNGTTFDGGATAFQVENYTLLGHGNTNIINNTTGVFSTNSNPLTGAVTFSGNTTDIIDYKTLEPSATPTSPSAGNMYFDSTTNKHRGYDGTSWNDFY